MLHAPERTNFCRRLPMRVQDEPCRLDAARRSEWLDARIAEPEGDGRRSIDHDPPSVEEDDTVCDAIGRRHVVSDHDRRHAESLAHLLDQLIDDVHATFGLLIGGGEATSATPTGTYQRSDGFLVIEPDIGGELELGLHATLALGGGYRLISPTAAGGFTAARLGGPVAMLAIRLGEL